jgi:hypothetical protein
MKRTLLILITAAFPLIICAQNNNNGKKLKYYGKESFLHEGTAFNDSVKQNFYDRFPLSYKDKVRGPVWSLSRNSAGLSVRFLTNSSSIGVKWELISDSKMNHMAETGIKGIDLYYKTERGWEYINTGRPQGKSNEYLLISGLSPQTREYRMYLPLYDGVNKLEVGIDSLGSIQKAPRDNRKPIVFYGTSITQGGCASRPGMTHTNIISRKLDIECINFGFSGNGKMEEPVAVLMSGIDALFYVIDGTNNMQPEDIHRSAIPLIETIRKKQPYTPIVFVEGLNDEKERLSDKPGYMTERNNALKEEYGKMKGKDFKNVFYIEIDDAKGTDHEATVDGVHLTDLGFYRYADFLINKFRKLKLLPKKQG